MTTVTIPVNELESIEFKRNFEGKIEIRYNQFVREFQGSARGQVIRADFPLVTLSDADKQAIMELLK